MSEVIKSIMAAQQYEQEKEQERQRGGIKKWLLAALVVFLSVAGSAAVGYFFFGGGGKFSSFASTGGEAKVKSVSLDTFTVNLSDMGFRRYLRTDITLECYNDDTVKEIEQKKYKIRDKIITILNQKKVSDFESNEKFERVRMELFKAVNSILSPPNQIKALYFENFIIQ